MARVSNPNNKVITVFMCAGFSSRFDGKDKFLQQINLYQNITIFDLMFLRLRKNGANLNSTIIILCNDKNYQKIQKQLKKNNYYGFNIINIHLSVSFSLPIFDQTGEYCFSQDIKLIKRSSGTANCVEQLFNNQNWLPKDSKYVYFSGMQNLMENPCNPHLLGMVHAKKKKAGSICSVQQFSKEPLHRICGLSSTSLKILEPQSFNQLPHGILDNLPIAMNSLVFEIENLKQIIKDYTTNISLAKQYRILQTQSDMLDLNKNKIIKRRCFNFQKDIRNLINFIKDPLLMKVSRFKNYAPIMSFNRNYSFCEATTYYRSALEKQLIEL